MALGWARSTQVNQNNSGFFGSVPMIGVSPDQTVRRSYWNISLSTTAGGVNVYPPGGSICRVGLVFDVAGLTPLQTPTPITNADADWLDIETLCPNVQFTTSTQNNWQLVWCFPKDESVKSQRKNDTAGNKVLYVAWEFTVAPDAMVGFAILNWNSSVDALINTP